MDTISRIIEQMQTNNIKDAELERLLGLKPKIVYGWKNGRSKSYMDYIPQLADLFGVTTDYLLCRTDQKNPPTEDKPIEEMEMQELLEHLAHREECRMLFSLAKGCTKEEILQTIKIIEALKK